MSYLSGRVRSFHRSLQVWWHDETCTWEMPQEMGSWKIEKTSPKRLTKGQIQTLEHPWNWLWVMQINHLHGGKKQEKVSGLYWGKIKFRIIFFTFHPFGYLQFISFYRVFRRGSLYNSIVDGVGFFQWFDWFLILQGESLHDMGTIRTWIDLL